MKKQQYGFLMVALTLGFIFGGMVSQVFGDTEIDLDDTNPAVTTPTPSGPGSTKVVATPTAIPMATPIPTMVIKTLGLEATPTETVEVEEDATPIEVHGVIKMKDIYSAGIKAYQEEDYDKAIRYLKKSLDIQDPYSAKFYYAEANAMLGVSGCFTSRMEPGRHWPRISRRKCNGLVDGLVWSLVKRRELRPEAFDHSGGGCWLLPDARALHRDVRGADGD